MDTEPSDTEHLKIDEAVKAAETCDVIVAVLGDDESMVGEINPGGKLPITVTATVKNTGERAGEEVIQLRVSTVTTYDND